MSLYNQKLKLKPEFEKKDDEFQKRAIRTRTEGQLGNYRRFEIAIPFA